MFLRLKNADTDQPIIVRADSIHHIAIDDSTKKTTIFFMDKSKMAVKNGFNELSDALVLNKYTPTAKVPSPASSF